MKKTLYLYLCFLVLDTIFWQIGRVRLLEQDNSRFEGEL